MSYSISTVILAYIAPLAAANTPFEVGVPAIVAPEIVKTISGINAPCVVDSDESRGTRLVAVNAGISAVLRIDIYIESLELKSNRLIVIVLHDP